MSLDINTTTLKEAAEAAQRKGFQYIRLDGLNTCFIEDFLDGIAQDEEPEGPDDYARINSLIFRVSEIGKEDADVYEVS